MEQIESLAEQLFFTTVRIETETATGQGVGTGFFLAYTKQDKQYLFVVSNKHVIREAKRGLMLFVEGGDGRPKVGQGVRIVLDNFEDLWFGHQDSEIDVAVMPLVPVLHEIQKARKEVFFKTISTDLIPDSSKLAELDAIEEVLFIGYPSGLYDKANLVPIARRGMTATPIGLDYCGKKMFLVDASVFPGSSGSPVFIYDRGSYSPKKGGLVVGSRFMFVGVISSVAVREELGEISIVEIPILQTPIVRTRQMIDLGLVFRSETVVETVEAFLRNVETRQTSS